MPASGSGKARQRIRALALALAAAFAAVVALGFLGDLLPAFDSLAHFRAHASVGLLVLGAVLLIARQGAAGLGALALAALGLYSVLPFMLAAETAGADAMPGAPRYTLLQMNLRFDAPDRARALSLIAARRPDVVTVQETTPTWRAELERLRSGYPYQFFCTDASGNSDVAILSRRPFVEDPGGPAGASALCRADAQFAARTIDFNGLPVTVASQHLEWPWPWPQRRMLERLGPALATLRDPLLVAGDFNAAPWSAVVRRYAAQSRTNTLAGIGPTWIAGFLPPALARRFGLPIDNVLVSDGVTVLGVERLAPTTSDHLPVLVTFTMRFAVPEEPEVRSAGRS